VIASQKCILPDLTELIRPSHAAFIKKWISILDPASDVDNAYIQSMLQDIFSGYVALTDNPGAMFVEELVQAFPDAKVIATIRDADSWWESIKEVEKALVPWWLPRLWSIMPTLRYFGEWHQGLVKRYVGVSIAVAGIGLNVLLLVCNRVTDILC
jgi:hypothetical protein